MKFYNEDGTVLDHAIGMNNYYQARRRITAYEVVILSKEPIASMAAAAAIMEITPQRVGMILKAVTRILYNHLVDEVKARHPGKPAASAAERRELWDSFGQGMYACSQLDIYNNLRNTPMHELLVQKFPLIRDLFMAQVAHRIEY